MARFVYKLAPFLVATFGLGACASTDEVAATARYSSAGNYAGMESFGIATQTNTLRMSDANFYSLELAARFANDVDTVVNFATNSAELDTQAKSIIRRQANWIKQFPEVRLRVYGHADATGSSQQNKLLGQRRAHAVVSYMIQNGISKNRVQAVTSLGDSQPMIVTPGDERINRRAVTEVTGFVTSHPMVMNGEYGQIVYRNYTGTASDGL